MAPSVCIPNSPIWKNDLPHSDIPPKKPLLAANQGTDFKGSVGHSCKIVNAPEIYHACPRCLTLIALTIWSIPIFDEFLFPSYSATASHLIIQRWSRCLCCFARHWHRALLGSSWPGWSSLRWNSRVVGPTKTTSPRCQQWGFCGAWGDRLGVLGQPLWRRVIRWHFFAEVGWMGVCQWGGGSMREVILRWIVLENVLAARWKPPSRCYLYNNIIVIIYINISDSDFKPTWCPTQRVVVCRCSNNAGADPDACASLSKVEDLQGEDRGVGSFRRSQFEGVLIIHHFKFRRFFEVANCRFWTVWIGRDVYEPLTCFPQSKSY